MSYAENVTIENNHLNSHILCLVESRNIRVKNFFIQRHRNAEILTIQFNAHAQKYNSIMFSLENMRQTCELHEQLWHMPRQSASWLRRRVNSVDEFGMGLMSV